MAAPMTNLIGQVADLNLPPTPTKPEIIMSNTGSSKKSLSIAVLFSLLCIFQQFGHILLSEASQPSGDSSDTLALGPDLPRAISQSILGDSVGLDSVPSSFATKGSCDAHIESQGESAASDLDPTIGKPDIAKSNSAATDNVPLAILSNENMPTGELHWLDVIIAQRRLNAKSPADPLPEGSLRSRRLKRLEELKSARSNVEPDAGRALDATVEQGDNALVAMSQNDTHPVKPNGDPCAQAASVDPIEPINAQLPDGAYVVKYCDDNNDQKSFEVQAEPVMPAQHINAQLPDGAYVVKYYDNKRYQEPFEVQAEPALSKSLTRERALPHKILQPSQLHYRGALRKSIKEYRKKPIEISKLRRRNHIRIGAARLRNRQKSRQPNLTGRRRNTRANRKGRRRANSNPLSPKKTNDAVKTPASLPTPRVFLTQGNFPIPPLPNSVSKPPETPQKGPHNPEPSSIQRDPSLDLPQNPASNTQRSKASKFDQVSKLLIIIFSVAVVLIIVGLVTFFLLF